MFNTREQKQKLKNILKISSIFLVIFFSLLLLYGMVFVRPNTIAKASKLGQYYEFNSSELPVEQNHLKQHFQSDHSVFVKDAVQDNEFIGEIKDKEVVHHLEEKPCIAILVTNLGLNVLSTELALSLPKEVSLGFVPYTTSLKPLLKKAQNNGHEIFIYMPFETSRYPDDSPGQNPLLLSLDDNENLHRMHKLLHSFDDYVGIYGVYNEVFTNSNKIGAILAEIAGKKLKLFTSNGFKHDGETDDLILSSDINIDIQSNIPDIKKQLDLLVEHAKSHKKAIGYVNSYPVTIYTLKAWIPTLESMGIELVPVTAITSKGITK